jgi:hypothetical protein
MNWFSAVDPKMSWQEGRTATLPVRLRWATPAAFLKGVFWVSLFAVMAPAQAPPARQDTVHANLATPALDSRPTGRRVSPYRAAASSASAKGIYGLRWGADSFQAKLAESGQVVRFSYRVTDAQKAKQLNDKKAEPYLIDQRAKVKLVVPTMEKVGQLRQSSPPEAGKSYWMVFSNKGGLVKRGDRVSVVIGKFRVDELVVE